MQVINGGKKAFSLQEFNKVDENILNDKPISKNNADNLLQYHDYQELKWSSLIVRAKNNDRKAYFDLLCDMEAWLEKYFRIMPPAAILELSNYELVEITMFDVYRKLEAFENKSSVKKWLGNIADQCVKNIAAKM